MKLREKFDLLYNDKWTQAQLIWRRGCSDLPECSATISGLWKPCFLTLRLRSLLCITEKTVRKKNRAVPDFNNRWCWTNLILCVLRLKAAIVIKLAVMCFELLNCFFFVCLFVWFLGFGHLTGCSENSEKLLYLRFLLGRVQSLVQFPILERTLTWCSSAGKCTITVWVGS